jgi:DNA-directed RNA polymerase sigma subunit (sigma70/sigma32)
MKEKEIESLINPVKNNELKLIESDVKTALENSMKTLTPREELVVKHRHGINTEMKTLDEIAKFMGITRERVRQIEVRGLRKLRHPSRIYKILQAGVKDVYTKLDIKNEDLKRAELFGQTWAKKIN